MGCVVFVGSRQPKPPSVPHNHCITRTTDLCSALRMPASGSPESSSSAGAESAPPEDLDVVRKSSPSWFELDKAGQRRRKEEMNKFTAAQELEALEKQTALSEQLLEINEVYAKGKKLYDKTMIRNLQNQLFGRLPSEVKALSLQGREETIRLTKKN